MDADKPRHIWLELPQLNLNSILAIMSKVKSHGRLPGSVEPEATAGLDYGVVPGPVVDKYFPSLWQAARKVETWVQVQYGPEYHLSQSKKRAVNINVLATGQRYERHTDGNELTVIAFWNENYAGGELLAGDVTIEPRVGRAAAIFGGRVEHEVLPVRSGYRVTAIFSFERSIDENNESLERGLD